MAPTAPLKSGLPSDPERGGLTPRQGGVGRQREKFLAGAQPRLPLVSTPQTSMEQTRVHRTGHAPARAKDLLAMSIPPRMAGLPISGATDMEAPPSSAAHQFSTVPAGAPCSASTTGKWSPTKSHLNSGTAPRTPCNPLTVLLSAVLYSSVVSTPRQISDDQFGLRLVTVQHPRSHRDDVAFRRLRHRRIRFCRKYF